MRRNELSHFLKKLNPGLRVVRHSNRGEHVFHGGSDAVYFYSRYIGAVPPGAIYFHGNPFYRGEKYVNRSLRGLIKILVSAGVVKPHRIMEAYRDTTSL